MASFYTAGKRSTSDVRRSATARAPINGNSTVRRKKKIGDEKIVMPDRAADFEVLIDRAITLVRAAGDRPDLVFGPFAELNSIVRAVAYHEGRLLEWGLARLAAENPSLVLLPPSTSLPRSNFSNEINGKAWKVCDCGRRSTIERPMRPIYSL